MEKKIISKKVNNPLSNFKREKCSKEWSKRLENNTEDHLILSDKGGVGSLGGWHFEPATFKYCEPTRLSSSLSLPTLFWKEACKLKFLINFPIIQKKLLLLSWGTTAVSQSFYFCGFLQIVEYGIDEQIFWEATEIFYDLLCAFKHVFSTPPPFLFDLRAPFYFPTK